MSVRTTLFPRCPLAAAAHNVAPDPEAKECDDEAGE
jgi:hypothetical protein